MSVPDVFRSNGYRTLRLSADATLAQIHNASASWKRFEALGMAGMNDVDLPQLGDVSRSESDLRSAVDRLTTPAPRLRDRLFWFHRAHGLSGQAYLQSAEPVIAKHDEALRAVIDSLLSALDEPGIAARVQSLHVWHEALSEDVYWRTILALDERGAFEPVASASEAEQLRNTAVPIAADGLIVAGRDSASRGDFSTAGRIIAGLGKLADTGPWASAAMNNIVSPLVAGFHTSCRELLDQPERVTRGQHADTSRNRAISDKALQQFREKVAPALDRLKQLLPDDHATMRRCREEAALCLAIIGGDYTWADAFVVAEKLLTEARELAHGTPGVVRIGHGLSQVRDSARRERFFGQLRPISEPPSLATINGIGCTFYGRSDEDPETNSYATVHYFVVFFIPLFALGQYRVIQSGYNSYRILGQLPLRMADCWHLGITAFIAVVLLIMLIANAV